MRQSAFVLHMRFDPTDPIRSLPLESAEVAHNMLQRYLAKACHYSMLWLEPTSASAPPNAVIYPLDYYLARKEAQEFYNHVFNPRRF